MRHGCTTVTATWFEKSLLREWRFVKTSLKLIAFTVTAPPYSLFVSSGITYLYLRFFFYAALYAYKNITRLNPTTYTRAKIDLMFESIHLLLLVFFSQDCFVYLIFPLCLFVFKFLTLLRLFYIILPCYAMDLFST